MAELAGSYMYDWRFHQATGMVATQIGTRDMGEAACRLIALAAVHGLSPHEAAVLVVDRKLEVGY